MTEYELFARVIKKVEKNMGTGITLTKNDVADGDNFLIFSAYDSITISFKKRRDGVFVVLFDGEDPMLLENCPISFYRTLLKNLP